MGSRKNRVLVAMAVLASLLAGWYGQRYWLIVADGATAAAVDIKVERQPVMGKNSGDPFLYYAEYRFSDGDGRVHESRQRIARDLYQELAGGGSRTLTVHYSRSRPQVNMLDMESARYVPLILTGLSAFLWVVVMVRVVRG